MRSDNSTEKEHFSTPSKTILIAEDDRDDQELLREAFRQIEHPVDLHIVNNGKSVLDYLQEVKDEQLPCLIVLDYNMPLLNGGEVLDNIAAESRLTHIPKVVLSTSKAAKDIEKCLEKGAKAFITKPINFIEFVTLAKQLLNLCEEAA